ncbi:hypothetical protein Pfo_001125 [Paulownia fortunei]|nr:hypothetical protein Pfo_001125 [Paulownia fortunei]
MGSKRDWLIIWIMFCALLWPHVQASESYTQDSLNSFLYDYAFKRMPRPRTGKLYNVSLPVNFSSMEVSVIRLRTHSLWKNGANLSFFEIPPRTLPWPFTKRVDIVYQNLGNWSTSYYNVQNYTFVAPVIGFLAYDSNTSSRLIELNISGDNPIIIRFQNHSLEEDENVRMKCVRFGTNGTLEFSNVTAKSSCVARGQGHFSVVIPYQPKKDKKKRVLKWWMIGVPAGVVGLVLLVVLGIVAYKLFIWKKIRKLERQSERSEALDTIWVGNSRMPSASGIRTQPALENSYVP